MDAYAEVSYKTKKSLGILIFKIIAVIITALAVLFIIMTKVTILSLIAGLIVIAEFYGFSRMNSEFEIVYCDGQFDFDKISGTLGRKTLFKVDMEQVEVIAPYGHEALDSYRNVPVKKRMIPGKEEDSYVIVAADMDGNLRKILFPPTEKMLNCIYHKAPSKLKKNK